MTLEQQKENDLKVGLDLIAKGRTQGVPATEKVGGDLVYRAIYPRARQIARRLGMHARDFANEWFKETIDGLYAKHQSASGFGSRSANKFPISAYVETTLRGMSSKVRKRHYEGRPLYLAFYDHIRNIDFRPPPPDRQRRGRKTVFLVPGVVTSNGQEPDLPAAPVQLVSNYRWVASDADYKQFVIDLICFLGKAVTYSDIAEHLAKNLEHDSPQVHPVTTEEETGGASHVDLLADAQLQPEEMQVALDVQLALGTLTHYERKLFLLREQEGCEFAEVASQVGLLDPEKARTEHRRIQKKLRDVLGGAGYE